MKKTFKLLALVAMASALAFSACTKDEPDYNYTNNNGNGNGGGTQTRPTASFTASSSNFMVCNSVSFSNYSSNANSYHWDFGDFDYSTERNPTHMYRYAGSYVVELTAYNGTNSSTATKTIRAVNPNYCTINRLKLQYWPARNSNGNTWDQLGNASTNHPDIYFKIKNSSGTVLYTSSVVDDQVHPYDGGTTVPVWNVNLKMMMNESYTIEFWDDELLADEQMVNINCGTLMDDFYYPFSTTLNLQTTSGDWEWTLYVTWSLY